MSLQANTSQRRINHLANTLVLLLQTQVPALARGGIITTEIINRVREIVRKNLDLLGSVTLLTAGLLTLLPSLIVTAVNILGFTAAGVLKGSIAAAIQSAAYGGQAGGWFAILQSFGATAMISPPIVIGVGVSLAVIGTGFLGYTLWRRHRERRQVDPNGRKSSPDRRDDEDEDEDEDPNSHGMDSSPLLQVVKSPRQSNFWSFFHSRK